MRSSISLNPRTEKHVIENKRVLGPKMGPGTADLTTILVRSAILFIGEYLLPDSVDKPDLPTLPDPDLNPLSNPLLSEHMGRWAEVYFTSPPENRQQAVQELLRELGGKSSTAETVPVREQREPQRRLPDEAIKSETSPKRAPVLLVCRSCGEKNPEQKFCGMCGATLPGTALLMTSDLPEMSLAKSAAAGASGSRDWAPISPTFDAPIEEGPLANYGSRFNDSTDDLREKLANSTLHLIPEYEPAPYRYRLYVGLALALLISALVYMSWRSTGLWSRGSTPAAPPSASLPVLPPSTQSTTPPSPSTGDKAGETMNGQTVAKRTESAGPIAAISHKPRPAEMPIAPKTAPARENARIVANRGNGAEELVVAENYLNGRRGAARDPNEAAKWLWRSVGKQNAAAALLLSDLYLRGDGVSKSCDQARLLLDAAARKGVAGAGGRLRNLQTLGCP